MLDYMKTLAMFKAGQPAKTERNRLIVEYRDKTGMSFEKLGRIFGITRQRAHKIYQTYHQNQQKGD